MYNIRVQRQLNYSMKLSNEIRQGKSAKKLDDQFYDRSNCVK